MQNKRVILAILDGFGLNPEQDGNAIYNNTKHINEIEEKSISTSIKASGMAVGLPDGQMGNSEVGHTNIGAGRIVYQELTRITKSIKDGDFFDNNTFLGAVDNCKRNNSALHLMGLLSDGGVHSHNTHLYALLELAKKQGLKDVYIHAFLDGRDVSPKSGYGFIEDLIEKTKELGIGTVATVTGRYYVMDRDNRWERVIKAYNMLALGDAPLVTDPLKGVRASYDRGVADEFVEPFICIENGSIKQNDSVIFYNFRPDRAREITRAFIQKDFNEFVRKNGYFPLHFVSMTAYDKTFKNINIAYSPQTLDNTLGEYLSKNSKKQLRIAETEKYAHVTFFFNGGVEKEYENEDRILIPSPKVATYDLKPEMSAYEVCDAVVEQIDSKKYDVIILNFANCDMVGHTGIFKAATDAVLTVDKCVGRVYEAALRTDCAMIITADHGNAEKMLESDGVSPFTAHTTYDVPFILANLDCKLRADGVLSDIAPTVLDIIGLGKPAEMSADTLIM